MSIKSLGLSNRATNCLIAEGIYTAEQFAELDQARVMAIPNIGHKTACEIAWCLVDLASGQLLEQVKAWDKYHEERLALYERDKALGDAVRQMQSILDG